jgi:deoxyribonuclease (pyrimidine dimer)
MVRINIIKPCYLTDQHLVAEYLEILMLVSYARKHLSFSNISQSYRLGTGHITFFKNKLRYLKKRHEELKSEMRKRGFTTRKTVDLSYFSKEHLNDWKPTEPDKKLIRKRLIEKIKEKPGFYRYYGKYRSNDFLLGLVKKSK